jgi:hypothetical protein
MFPGKEIKSNRRENKCLFIFYIDLLFETDFSGSEDPAKTRCQNG